MSSVLDQLASASGQAKQDLNIALARKIAEEKNTGLVNELISGLNHKTRSIRHDCIKTLYEIANLQPSLISPHSSVFISLLENKDNRMQWGCLIALSAITSTVPEQVFSALPQLIYIADQGSVIKRDYCVRIFILLSTHRKYQHTVMPLLLGQLLLAPVNQAPAYAEQIYNVLTKRYKADFEEILLMRLNDTEQESRRKRLENVLKKLK